jgi:hypothetical protein
MATLRWTATNQIHTTVGPASGLQDPPLPDTDSPEALGSNILSNKPLEYDCTGSVEAQVRRPVISRAMIVFMISDVPP